MLVNFQNSHLFAGQAGSEAGGWHTYILGVLGIPWACGQYLKEEQWRRKGTKEILQLY